MPQSIDARPPIADDAVGGESVIVPRRGAVPIDLYQVYSGGRAGVVAGIHSCTRVASGAPCLADATGIDVVAMDRSQTATVQQGVCVPLRSVMSAT